MVKGSMNRQVDEISDLCDDLVEHLQEAEQAEALQTVEEIARKVREFFGVTASG
ncbi:MAG: hypothetical protein IT305_29700 [Chloroflexi bacterium]|nr:hypothetical protein [Chloroflexota bacterium]